METATFFMVLGLLVVSLMNFSVLIALAASMTRVINYLAQEDNTQQKNVHRRVQTYADTALMESQRSVNWDGLPRGKNWDGLPAPKN